MPPEDDEITGGQGDGTRLSRADLRLLRRAARRRWGVPDDYQTETLFQVGRILANSDDDRLKLAAAKFLLEATKTDQRDEIEAAKHEADPDNARDALTEAEAADTELDRERQERPDRGPGPEVPG